MCHGAVIKITQKIIVQLATLCFRDIQVAGNIAACNRSFMSVKDRTTNVLVSSLFYKYIVVILYRNARTIYAQNVQ